MGGEILVKQEPESETDQRNVVAKHDKQARWALPTMRRRPEHEAIDHREIRGRRRDQISLQKLSISREHQPIRAKWPDGLSFR